jgi:hypothetical protein
MLRNLLSSILSFLGFIKKMGVPSLDTYPDGSQYWYLNRNLHREDGPAIIREDGYEAWYLNGKLHREGGPAFIDPDGIQEWYLNGLLHREGGPALTCPDGSQEWYLNGKLHREDGPAFTCPDGSQEWHLNGHLHREGGPAVSYSDGTQYWYLNGVLHREGGPAVSWPSGTQLWYLNGVKVDPPISSHPQCLKDTSKNPLTTLPEPLEGDPTTPGVYILQLSRGFPSLVEVFDNNGTLFLDKHIYGGHPIEVNSFKSPHKWYGPFELPEKP